MRYLTDEHRQVSNAEALLAALHSSGVKHVFTNAGTDTAPIIEALAQTRNSNQLQPIFLVTPHENVAMAMAHGHYRFSGNLAAVLLHTTVGSANAIMGVMNAHRDQVPILMLAGRTPNTEHGELGSRSAHIHWGQETFDQGAMMRDWLKWDYELRAGQPIETLIQRATGIATTAPPGPVYLTLPREVIAGPATISDNTSLVASSVSVPQSSVVEEIVDALVGAEFPLIVTSSGGREVAAFHALADLARTLAIPVAQPFATDANLPSTHAMNFGMEGMGLVAEADLILVLEAGVPWVQVQPKADVRVIQVAADPQYASYPLRGFRTDLAVAAAAPDFLAMLNSAVEVRSLDRKKLDKRTRLLTQLNSKRRERIAAVINDDAQSAPITTAWLANCLNRAKAVDAIVINELGVPVDYLELNEPRTYMRESTAGGLGFGLGAALGAKLVQPDREVIAVVGDGSYMFGNPTPAHFVARAQKLGTLTIINNNQRWQAVHNAASGMYPGGEAVQSETMPLTDLSPSPHFEQVVKASDGHGERIEDPGELLPAIERGLEAAQAGTPAVLNVITAP
ncbi:MAG: thiamine pyrophosphate-requiring protein [Pseudomonadales bacterium]